jgi:sugar-specific transcriptional regulator TrmB
MPPDNIEDSANSQESYFLAADLFSFFADLTALMIWDIVRKKEMSASAIAKKLQADPPRVLKTLQAMEQKGILASRTRSYTTLYKMADLNAARAFNTILELPKRNRERTGNIGKARRLNRQKATKYSRRVISVYQGTPR